MNPIGRLTTTTLLDLTPTYTIQAYTDVDTIGNVMPQKRWRIG